MVCFLFVSTLVRTLVPLSPGVLYLPGTLVPLSPGHNTSSFFKARTLSFFKTKTLSFFETKILSFFKTKTLSFFKTKTWSVLENQRLCVCVWFQNQYIVMLKGSIGQPYNRIGISNKSMFYLYGTCGALDGCKRLPWGVGIISPLADTFLRTHTCVL